MADRVQELRQALVAIVRASETVQSLAGRRERLIMRQESFDQLPMPGLTYVVIAAVPIGGTGRPLRVTVQLTGWADGADSSAQAAAVLDAALEALTAPAFAEQGLDAVPARAVRRDAPVDAQGARRLAREDADLDLEVRVS